MELLENSSLPLVQEMAKQLKAQREGRHNTRNSNGRFVTMKPRNPTVSARFSESLQQLLTSMSKCNPFFVRCMKPNEDKQARKVDMPCLLNQLRCLGIYSTVKIRKQGYPVRLRFQHFVERYRHLLKPPIPRGVQYRDLCRLILDTVTNSNDHNYQLGATRVFLRENLHRLLEHSRCQCLNSAAITIQKNVRRVLLKRRNQRQEKSAVLIQKVYRGYRERKRYQELKTGVVKAQSMFRGKKERRNFEKIKKDVGRKSEAEKHKRHQITQSVRRDQFCDNSIFHLDVPAELAFIFSRTDGWVNVHVSYTYSNVLSKHPNRVKNISRVTNIL